jgi:hypothetical protein
MRRLGAAAVVGCLMLGLGGCQDSVPVVDPPPEPAEPPVIVESGQIDRILNDLGAALDAAAEEGSVEPMRGRVSGAALTMAEAQFKGEKANPQADRPELGSTFLDSRIVTRSSNWPRSFVVAAEYEEAKAPFVYRIEQADPRGSYQLVSWAQMLAGVEVPRTALPEVGSAVVAPTAEGLVMTPLAAAQAYAVAKGDVSSDQAKLLDTAPTADGVDLDPVRARWLAVVKALSDGVAEFSGSAKQASEVVEGSVFAVATIDSGALVFAQVTSTLEASFTTPEGGTVNLVPGGYEGLGEGGLSATKSARIEHLQTVVLAVPPEGSDELIQVIAVSDTPTAVTVE